MGVPYRRTSLARKKKRRSHLNLQPPNWMDCPNCGETMQRHRVCPSCGMYKDRQVIEIVEKGT